MSTIPDFKTEHFLFPGRQIEKWNEENAPLPASAGSMCIALSDVEAVLRKPFYYDFTYETNGHNTSSPTLVYNKKLVDDDGMIHHFPFCKELVAFLEWTRKQYHWTIFYSWQPLYESVRGLLAYEQGRIPLHQVADKTVVTAFQKNYNLRLSGYVQRNELKEDGEISGFWCGCLESAIYARCFGFNHDHVYPNMIADRHSALSVRCVVGS